MMRCKVALNAGAVAAVALAMVSCNFMMPAANYPVMRQEKGFHLIASYWIPVDDRLSAPQFSFGILDGMTAFMGPSPAAYIGIRGRYAKDPAIMYLSPGAQPIMIFDTSLQFDFERLLMINAPGFIGRIDMELREIYWDGSSLRADILDTILNIESYAINAMTPLRALGSNVFASLASGTRGIFDEGAELSVQGFGSLPAAATHSAIYSHLNTKSSISSAFTILQDETGSSGFFWNRGQFEIRKSGFTETGAFTWLEARRYDSVTEDEELLLVSLKDDVSPPIVSDRRPIGTAGDYVLTLESAQSPSFEFAALNADLNEVASIKLYGLDAIFLGEAQVVLDAVQERCAVFATLGSKTSGDDRAIIVTLFAYPIRLFSGGTP